MNGVRVTTGSRIHFGLLRLPPAPEWPDDGTRYYGGAGLMIDEPGVEVAVELATEWSATGPSAERALAAARRFATAIESDGRFAIYVDRAPAEHVGLGTGTQLELAVAIAASRAIHRWDEVIELAHILGRGRRSAVGVHGFARGGFIVDGGKRRPSELGSLAERIACPADWRIVLVTPNVAPSWHGGREGAAFTAIGAREDEHLQSLLLETMAPAIRRNDFAEFAQAVGEYNARAGEYYRALQGGQYCDPAVAEVVNWLRERGAGAGQSSWGPTVFAVVADEISGQALATLAAAKFPPEFQSRVCRPLALGAQCRNR